MNNAYATVRVTINSRIVDATLSQDVGEWVGTDAEAIGILNALLATFDSHLWAPHVAQPEYAIAESVCARFNGVILAYLFSDRPDDVDVVVTE